MADKHSMKKLLVIALLSIIPMTVFAYGSAYIGFGGYWVSSTCYAASGAFHIYPSTWADYVGTACKFPDGTPGVYR